MEARTETLVGPRLPRPGDLIGSKNGTTYMLMHDGSLRRVDPKERGKAARRRDKREARLQRELPHAAQ